MTYEKESNYQTDFEQKLAAFEPRVLRNVTLQTASRYFETKNPLPHYFRYAAVGLTCFVLGAAAMYGVMRLPPARQEKFVPPPSRYAMIDFSEAQIAKLRRPIDVIKLTRKATPVPSVSARPNEPEKASLFMLQREMLKNIQEPGV